MLTVTLRQNYVYIKPGKIFNGMPRRKSSGRADAFTPNAQLLQLTLNQ